MGFYIVFQNPIQVLASYPLTKETKNHKFYFSMALFFQLQRALESPGQLVQTLVAEPHVQFPVCQSSMEPEICISHKFPGGAGPLRQDLYSRTTVVRCTHISWITTLYNGKSFQLCM